MDGATVESETAVAAPSQAGNQTPPTHGTLVDEAARVATTLNDKLPTLSQETRIPANHRGAPEEASARDAHARDEGREAFDARSVSSPEHESRRESAEDEAAVAGTPVVQADTRGGRMRQRAASVGASVGENLRPRVEKLREASTVVFDEASDDPGLRFLIVAALLFLLFLFILLFSYILG